MPIITLVGHPRWGRTLEEVCTQLGFELRLHTEREGYVTRLIDDHAALIVVDGSLPDWSFWTATPKASPATRRIPVVLISDDAALRTEASRSGADFTLPPDMLATELPTLLRKNARIQDEATAAQLTEQCTSPLPDLAQQAIEQFNAGEYYRQHDLLEEQWMLEEGPVRDLYRAILQVGIAYYQVQRGNRRGAYKMLLRSIQWLNILPDACQGVDVARLRADAAALRDAINREEDDLSMYLGPVVLLD